MNSVQNPAYRGGLEARFAVAARHSRMVRILRVAVPAAVVLAMAMVIGISVFNPFRMLAQKIPLDIGNVVVSGSKITMESPHLPATRRTSGPMKCGPRPPCKTSPIPIMSSSTSSGPSS